MIDVIIPAYNAAAYIGPTLASLVSQGSLISTVIVVNDGSTDQTAQIVQRFASEHPKLPIKLINQVNGGLSNARNTGITHSQSAYIALLDADDLWLADKLSLQYALFQNSRDPTLGLVYCGYQLIDETGEILPDSQGIIAPRLRGNVHQALLKGNFISGSGSSVLIKRSVFDAVGLFNEQLPACEDWEMWLRISKQFTVDYVDLPLVHIRQHRHSMQKDSMRMLSAELLVLNLFYQHQERNPFLLWKIRTILHSKHLTAQQIPSFQDCDPQLQSALTGWQQTLASIVLTPLEWAAQSYWKLKNIKA
jgi:glycosyltransferase involved in cell wall biosynthesis